MNLYFRSACPVVGIAPRWGFRSFTSPTFTSPRRRGIAFCRVIFSSSEAYSPTLQLLLSFGRSCNMGHGQKLDPLLRIQ